MSFCVKNSPLRFTPHDSILKQSPPCESVVLVFVSGGTCQENILLLTFSHLHVTIVGLAQS